MKNEGRFFIFVNQNINPTASTTLLNPKFLVLSNWFDLSDFSMPHSLTNHIHATNIKDGKKPRKYPEID